MKIVIIMEEGDSERDAISRADDISCEFNWNVEVWNCVFKHTEE